MPPQLFTIGHSTHSLERLLALLARHYVVVVADVRRFPGSRKYSQFNQDGLATSLPQAGVEYHWLAALGGRRGQATAGPSADLGLRNESFRNDADSMHTERFREGVRELLAVAGERPTALRCSEGVFWRCHRRLVADYLLANGVAVRHIMPSGELRPHTLTAGARLEAGALTYPPSDGADQEGVAG